MPTTSAINIWPTKTCVRFVGSTCNPSWRYQDTVTTTAWCSRQNIRLSLLGWNIVFMDTDPVDYQVPEEKLEDKIRATLRSGNKVNKLGCRAWSLFTSVTHHEILPKHWYQAAYFSKVTGNQSMVGMHHNICKWAVHRWLGWENTHRLHTGHSDKAPLSQVWLT